MGARHHVVEQVVHSESAIDVRDASPLFLASAAVVAAGRLPVNLNTLRAIARTVLLVPTYPPSG